eukprot:CAMPEP_0170288222 /NCGR_PEP_ID=MMETSP0116_2-20130129/44170_1 /TAXON_ID=400756 /ORGANISM="Durinskia baltica, Strain CSIRO CS-38" /LENGTH=68 /DNA_ID=CAMNT_0010539643 /DNA_START=86 /DNA_END=288 /DNA_ORIENTATION=+
MGCSFGKKAPQAQEPGRPQQQQQQAQQAQHAAESPTILQQQEVAKAAEAEGPQAAEEATGDRDEQVVV